jgi:hypothetical protein
VRAYVKAKERGAGVLLRHPQGDYSPDPEKAKYPTLQLAEPSGFDRAMRGAQPGSVERAPAGLIRRRAARRPGRGAGDPERAGAASAARPSKMA